LYLEYRSGGTRPRRTLIQFRRTGMSSSTASLEMIRRDAAR
jgi:hypothetical protein